MSVRYRLTRAASIDGLPIALALAAAVFYFSITSPFFMTGENIRNLLIQSLFIILLAAGMTFTLITGGFDLSVGSVTGLSAAMTLMTLMNGASLVSGVLAGIATGVVAGAINGFFIAVLKINGFIVTLASLSIGAGALQVITSHLQLTGVDSPAFAALTKGSFLGVPTGFWITLAVVGLLEWILLATSFGRGLFAVGTNREASFLAGLSVRRLTFSVYLISGTVAGAAGVLLASHLNSVQPGLGQGYELSAIAAAVLGGIALSGGRGSVWRSVVGALFLATLSQGLQLIGVDPMWFNIVTGASIVIAVAFDRGLQRLVAAQLVGTAGHLRGAKVLSSANRADREPASGPDPQQAAPPVDQTGDAGQKTESSLSTARKA